MDVFEYRTIRSFNTEGVFTALKTDTEIGGLFLRLKNLMVSECHLEWDIAFLDHYSKERMVPRGLRWNVYLQQGDVELEPWFRYFNEVGISLLGFLTEKNCLRMSVIDKEIQEIRDIRDKLLPHKSTTEYNSLSTNLKNHLEKEEREQKFKKQKKYTRDVNDYKNLCVFSWQNKDNTPINSDIEQLQMETLGQPESRSQCQQSSQPIQNRVEYTYNAHEINHSSTGLYTPAPNRKGSFPNHGGRGKETRGKGRGKRDHSQNYDYYRQDVSPPRR